MVFKERELYAASYMAGSFTEGDAVTDVTAHSAQFPITQLHGSIGCDCPHSIQLCGNRLVWIDSGGGVYTLAGTNGFSQTNVRKLSEPIEPDLSGYPANTLREASSGCFCGHYLLLLGNRLYLFPYEEGILERAASAGGAPPPWYRWRFPEDVFLTWLEAKGKEAVLLDEEGHTYKLQDWADRIWMPDQSRRTMPICFQLRSKLFDFSRPERSKAVRRLFLGIGHYTAGALQFAYCTDRGKAAEHHRHVLSEPKEGLRLNSCRLSPNLTRLRRMALEVSGEGAVVLTALTIDYDVVGPMRGESTFGVEL